MRIRSIKISSVISVCLTILLFVWYIPNYTKSIDVTDSCYSLINYKYFFEGYGHDLSMLFTNLLGGLIYKSLSSCNYFIYCMINALLFNLGLIITTIFKDYLSYNIRIIIALISSFFGLSNYHMFNYNTTTILALIISIYSLIESIKKDNNTFLFLSGIACGINLFFRFPNILFAINVLSIIYYYYKNGKNTAFIVKKFLLFCMGFIISILISVVLISCFVKDISIAQEIYGIFTTFVENDTSNSHSFVSIITQLIKQMSKTFIRFLPLIAFSLLVAFFTKKKIINNKIVSSVYIFIGIVDFAYIYKIRQLSPDIFCIIIILSFFASIYTLISNKYTLVFKSITIINNLTIMALPIGTDIGYVYYVYFVCMPMMVLISTLSILKGKIINNMIIVTIVVYSLLISINFQYKYVYRDSNYRYLKYEVQSKELKMMRTSFERAEMINNIYKEIGQLNNKKIITLGDFNLPTLITNNKPFFSVPWPDLNSFSYSQFCDEVDKSFEEELPIIILFPNSSRINDGESNYRSTKKYNKIQELINRYDYVIKYCDNDVIIYSK